MNPTSHPTSRANSLQLTNLTRFVAVLMALLLAHSSYAGFNQYSVGMKLGSDNTRTGNSTLNPTDTAGLPAVSQVNWNNLPAVSGSATLVDNGGITTAAGVAWFSALGTWSSGGNSAFPAGPDQVLMNGYLDNGATATVTITNLPSQLTSKGYDVYVYALFDTPNRGGTYSIVDGLNPANVLKQPVGLNSDSNPTNYVQDPQTPANYTGNYIVFHGLTNANIQLVAVATNTGTSRAGICGVQLVAAPAPGEAGSATGAAATPNGISGQLAISWNNGVSAQGALVVMRKGLPVTAQPVDGVAYNASQTFGSGDNLGDDEFGAGNYAVFNGATSGGSSSVTVSNLIPNTTYYVAVYSSTGSGASIDYTLAAPSVTNGVPTGNLSSLTLNVPSPVIIGSARHFSVQANYDNGTFSDITALATVTSSNTSIVKINGPGRLGAVTNGTVGLQAVYSAHTNIALVTVSPLSLTYRFSFNDAPGSLIVTDSVAGAVGVISNSPSTGPDGGGNLVFDGAGGYVTLPPNILTSYGGVTMEFWATLSAISTWERYWDFGSGQTVNMFMTPVAGGAILRTAFTVGGGGAETRVDYGYSADQTLHQLVFTLAGANSNAMLYIDGVQVSSVSTFALTPEDEGPTPNDYLGKSQYADPYLSGSMAEFRIYNGPLDPFSIALDAATGPDVITNNPGAISSLSVSAGSPIVQFGTEQVTVTGTFANIANPVNLASAPQTTYSTSDPNILTVSPIGVLTATGPGTGTLKVVSFGLTQSVQVVVTALPPGMTHRWSFNADFNDSLDATTPAIPHGTVSLDGLGNAVLDGTGAANTTGGSYVELPGNVLLGYSSAALECWYTDECGDGTGINRVWARLFDFGSGPGNNLFASMFIGGTFIDTMRFTLNTNNAGEWQVHIARPITNAEHHLVFNINATNHTATAYIDGEFAGQNQNFAVRPRDLGVNPNDWLGRSQYGDPLFQGLIDEFRIYNGTLDPVQVGIDFATGPNSVVNNPGAPTSVNVVLTTNILLGQTINAQCLANYASVTGAHVTSAGPMWSTSDPTVARVDQFGRLTAVGAGSATISATFSNLTGVATVSVAAQPPVLTHRYSFDSGDATDSVGGANGTATGTPVFANGMLTINDSSSWIALPGHLFDTNLEVTLEFWAVIASANGSGARMADFGTSADTNPNAFGRSAFGLAPTANGNNLISFRPSPGDQIGTPAIDSYGRPAFGTTNHYAFVISDINRRIDFYLNGALKDSYHYSSQPDEEIGGVVQLRTVLGYQFTNQTEGWFGKNVGSGLSGAVGSGFRGSIDEFRIWAGAMDKVQAQVSFQKGPENPQVNAGALQTLSVNINDPTMILGAVQKPSVSGTFANTSGQVDLTGYSPVTFTSDNSSIIAVVNGGNTKLRAVGVGTAHVVASYQSILVTNSITVIAKPVVQLTHRYSFRGNANDAIGQANGKLLGNAAIVGGRVVLDGSLNPSSYVLLPSDLISGYDLLTFEAFYAVPAGASGSQQRLWDFGNHVIASGGVEGSGYFYQAAGRGAVGLPNNLGSGSEATAIAPAADRAGYTTNTTCVAVTVDSINHILSIYTNGVFSASVTNTAVDLSLVTDNFSQLGRSQWTDPMYNGSIDEFRIYYGTLTPAQISDSFAGGPDPETLKTVLGPAAGQVTVSYPATLITAGYQLQVNSSLNSATWQPGPATTLVNGRNQAIINSGSTPSFFRLKK